MKSQVLTNFAWPELTTAAFFIFLFFFCGVLYWTFRKGTTKLYEDAGNTVFDEGQPANRSQS